MCVVMDRRRSSGRTCWTRASRAGSRGQIPAYWRKDRAKQTGSTPLPASWTPRQTPCSVPQPLRSLLDLRQHVRTQALPNYSGKPLKRHGPVSRNRMLKDHTTVNTHHCLFTASAIHKHISIIGFSYSLHFIHSHSNINNLT